MGSKVRGMQSHQTPKFQNHFIKGKEEGGEDEGSTLLPTKKEGEDIFHRLIGRSSGKKKTQILGEEGERTQKKQKTDPRIVSKNITKNMLNKNKKGYSSIIFDTRE